MSERMTRYLTSLSTAAGEVLWGGSNGMDQDVAGDQNYSNHHPTAPPLPEDDIPLLSNLTPVPALSPVSATTSSRGQSLNCDNAGIKIEPISNEDLLNVDSLNQAVTPELLNNVTTMIRPETLINNISSVDRAETPNNNIASVSRAEISNINNVESVDRAATPNINNINSVNRAETPNINNCAVPIIRDGNIDNDQVNIKNRGDNSENNNIRLSNYYSEVTQNESSQPANSGAQAIDQPEIVNSPNSIYPSLDYSTLGARPKTFTENTDVNMSASSSLSFNGFNNVPNSPPAALSGVLNNVGAEGHDQPPSYNEACLSPVSSQPNRRILGNIENQDNRPPPDGFDPTNVSMLAALQKGTGLFSSYSKVSRLGF